MANGAIFLGGAKGRLLPAAVVFQFFASAVGFYTLAWIALFFAAPALADSAGGLGWPLAALHLITLGVLTMTAIGASLQLLPVASRQPVAAVRWPYNLVWGLLNAGVLVLTLGMAQGRPNLLMAGAVGVAMALLAYSVLLIRNLIGARGMGLVVGHTWGAVAALAIMLASGLALSALYQGFVGIDRTSAILLHVSFAGYGFMGLLVMGFSYILVPMFALADNPNPRWSYLALLLALLALLGLLALAMAMLPERFFVLFIGLGASAFLLHVALMLHTLQRGMRRALGPSFVLVRLGWLALAASFGVALAREFGALAANGAALLGVLLVGGLLTLLLGILARIVPFLAAMHAASGRSRAPTASSLTAQRPLAIHFYCHISAMLLLLLAILAGSVGLVRASALLGLVAAVAYDVFFATAWRRMTS